MKEQEAPDFSNAVRLTGTQWIGVGIFSVALVLGAAPLWERVEKFDHEPDYRMPYDLSNDYWLYERYSRLAAIHTDTLVFGDSVVWGQYVTREQTLSHYLNERSGEERFANLGLDGAHPVALAGLLEHYAGGVTGKTVLLQCNPLWMSSPKSDLQIDEEFRFNHPRLVPQFAPDIRCYKEEYSPRIGIVVEQRLPFRGWTTHLQQVYYTKTDIPTWTLDHPYNNPFEAVTRGLPPSDDMLRHEPISWTKRGIKKEDIAWVDPETSLQWRSFQRCVEILQRHGNRVFVLVGPFNEHMLTDESRARYHRIKLAIETWLQDKELPYLAPEPLPSELYADASHPLSQGYAILARQVFEVLPGKE
jgi:lysophospholipase L1-like esterase